MPLCAISVFYGLNWLKNQKIMSEICLRSLIEIQIACATVVMGLVCFWDCVQNGVLPKKKKKKLLVALDAFCRIHLYYAALKSSFCLGWRFCPVRGNSCLFFVQEVHPAKSCFSTSIRFLPFSRRNPFAWMCSSFTEIHDFVVCHFRKKWEFVQCEFTSATCYFGSALRRDRGDQ